MRWFKHQLKHTPKIEIFIEKHGYWGYGIYMRLLELFAENIDLAMEDEAMHGFLDSSYYEYNGVFLRRKLKIDDQAKLDEVIASLTKLELLEEVDGLLYCENMKKWLDTYTSRTMHRYR